MLVSNLSLLIAHWPLPNSTKSAEQQAASNEKAKRRASPLDAHLLTARWPTANDQ